jgi:hypothetical protein
MRVANFLFLGFVAVAGLQAAAEAKPTRAAPQPLPQTPAPGPANDSAAGLEVGAHIDYQLYVHGLRIGRLEAGLDLRAGKYRIEVAFRTFGLVGWLFRGHQLDIAEGRLGRLQPEPLRFSGDGFWHGAPRRVLIDYVGGQPVLRNLEPPIDDDREAVPPALQANTMDTLSAMVLLIRRIAATGRCEAAVDTFDGRRAVQFSARTVGEEDLEATRRSSFSGRALRCDFEGKLLAGFHQQDSEAERRKKRHGSAWFAAAVPGAPLLPVRIEFETTWFGDATMYLIASGPGAARSPEAE